jgi:hypothetical protein
MKRRDTPGKSLRFSIALTDIQQPFLEWDTEKRVSNQPYFWGCRRESPGALVTCPPGPICYGGFLMKPMLFFSHYTMTEDLRAEMYSGAEKVVSIPSNPISADLWRASFLTATLVQRPQLAIDPGCGAIDHPIKRGLRCRHGT